MMRLRFSIASVAWTIAFVAVAIAALAAGCVTVPEVTDPNLPPALQAELNDYLSTIVDINTDRLSIAYMGPFRDDAVKIVDDVMPSTKGVL